MFGSDNIRVKIDGYLKNFTENENFEFSSRGIKNKNKIVFSFNNVKYNIRIKQDSIFLIREGEDFINSFIFNKRESESSYLLKENNYEYNIDVNTSLIDINDECVIIQYKVVDTNCLYEFKIEIGEIL